MFPLPTVVVLLSVLAGFLYQPLHSKNDLISGREKGILLLTAHPDDEAMFFAPTLLALTSQTRQRASMEEHNPASQQVLAAQRSNVYSLCLSVGNADGLGHVRPDELRHSLDILGVSEHNRWIVDHPYACCFRICCNILTVTRQLQDNITLAWDPTTIAEVLRPYVVDHGISAVRPLFEPLCMT